MDAMTLASNIKAARASKNLTQREVAVLAGISLPYLKQLESGRNIPPSVHHRLAKVLGMTVEELLTE